MYNQTTESNNRIKQPSSMTKGLAVKNQSNKNHPTTDLKNKQRNQPTESKAAKWINRTKQLKSNNGGQTNQHNGGETA